MLTTREAITAATIIKYQKREKWSNDDILNLFIAFLNRSDKRIELDAFLDNAAQVLNSFPLCNKN